MNLLKHKTVSKLCKEWSMSIMEINDIITEFEKKQLDIDYTNDLGDIIMSVNYTQEQVEMMKQSYLDSPTRETVEKT